MPPIKKTELEKYGENVLTRIDIYIGKRKREGWDMPRIWKSLGFNSQFCFRCRKLEPEKFSLQELSAISKALSTTVPKLLMPLRPEEII